MTFTTLQGCKLSHLRSLRQIYTLLCMKANVCSLYVILVMYQLF